MSDDRRYGLIGNTGIKVPCRLATTAAITLSAEQTIDGVAAVSGDRVLVKNQSSGVDNGIYVVDTGDWSRAADADGSYDFVSGTMIVVTLGSTNAGFWYLSTTGDIVPGTTSLTFTQIPTALGTTAYTVSLLLAANAAAARTTLGAVIGTDVQAYDSDLAAIAALSTTTFGRALLTMADAADLRTTAGLEIGTDVLAYSAQVAFLNVAQTWTKPQRGAYSALTSSGASIAVDLSTSANFNHTMTEDTTLAAPTNAVAGQSGVIEVTQHASAAKTLGFNSFWKWVGGSAGTISATTSSKNVIAYVVDSGGTFATCTLQAAVA